MKPLLRNNLIWKFSLLLAAAFLFVLSFVFNTVYTNRSSVAEEVKNAEDYLSQKQRDFNAFMADTSLISRLVENTESTSEFNEITDKPTGII